MSGMSDHKSNYWLDQIVDQAIESYPEGEIVVSSGISPSASYHVGHFREALTADAIAWGLRARGRDARHLHVVDNFDPLRKRYEFLPKEFEQYVGWPICLVPDPWGCHTSYVVHFTEEFKTAARKMGVEMDVIYSYEDQYKTGLMVPYIEQTLAKTDEIRSIFKEVAHREPPADWAPIQIVSDSKSMNEWRYVSHDTKTRMMVYRRPDGSEGELSYADGRVKLNWRLDWPARWALRNVRVEPFGKEHATKGGSYDTGAVFAREIFGVEPPLPLPYDTINLLGDNKKMSSSLGNLVTPSEALEIMPPEILRFFVLRSMPKRIIYFDSGLGLFNLIDEFSKLEEEVLAGGHPEFEQAYKVAAAIGSERTIAPIRFSHLVAVYQAAQGDSDRAMEILERTEYGDVVDKYRAVIMREFGYVSRWLEKYAPAAIKFSVQEQLPKVELSDEQKTFLAKLADTIEEEKDLNGQGIHDAIYAAAEVAEIKPSHAFQAIYRVLLDQDSGPKAGWFLASLDHDWLIRRLRLSA
jgi:lysyl-tRNA synthetase class 1